MRVFVDQPRSATRVLSLFVTAVALTAATLAGAETPPAAGLESPDRQPGAHAAAPPAAAQSQGAPAAEAGQGAGHHEEPLWKTGARLFNFAVLAGTLVYFLRAPMRAYFDGRISTIRGDLAKSAAMRATAAEQLAAVEARMRQLPGELAAMAEQGARDIAAERVRIREAAEAEQRRLVAQAQARAAQRVRGAERELMAVAADHVVAAATRRIEETINEADQARLIERYLAQVPEAGRATAAGGRP